VSTPLGRLLGAAGAVTALSALAQAAALSALAIGFGVRVPLVNGSLLLFATALLGAVWALRSKLRGGAASPSFGAALTPVLACALFVTPRLWLGPIEPALVTLAVAALAAAPLERVWSRWVVPEDAAWLPARAGLGAAAPPAAVALAASVAIDGSARAYFLGGALVLCAALAAGVVHRARRALEEARRYADYLDRIEVRPDAVLRPPPPPLRERWLRDLDREVRARAEELARRAESDAQAREQIADARQLRTRFMAAMGHELRSPLNSIVGFAQILERGLEGELSEGQRESVTMVRRSAEELIMLLTDVLDLARLEAGKLKLRREWTPSVEILTEAVARGRGIVEGRDVEIEAELQPGLPPVNVDARRIVQAVVALFRHAASSLDRTTIRLRARVAPGPPGPPQHLRVEIHDAIGAIPREEVERIFEAFQEISAPSGRRVGGLGMALSLSRGLVRLHGGEVWADAFPGAGTVLCVALPLD
jgi:signal transduction histidine kinase